MAIRRIVNLPSIDKKKADILNNGIVTPETITDKYGDTKDGELFINKNVDNELLIAKNADGNYIAFEPSKAIDGKFDEVNKRIDGVDNEINGIKSDYIKNISVNGSEGTVSANIASVTLDADDVKVGAEIKIDDTVISDETSITVKGSIENIVNEIVKNEQTTSGALNDLDGRVKTIENTQIKGVALPFSDKAVNIDLSEYAKSTDIANNYQPKGEYLSASTEVGEKNVIEAVKVDGTPLDIAEEDKSVNIILSPYAKTSDIENTYITKTEASTTYQPKGEYLSADTQYLSNITTSGEGNVVKEISQDGNNVKVVYGEAGTEVTINEIGAGNVITGITAEGMTVTVNRGQITTPEGGEENIISEIKVNDTPLKPDENKSVNIDLTGYQPKGNYLTSVPSEYANKIEIVKVNGTALNIDTSDKSVNVPIQDYTPTIGENGNWFIGGNDTNVKAKGENGQSAKITGATAMATTIAAGTNATVNVKSIGEDLSRGFDFTFGIPKGEKGDNGRDGTSASITGATATVTTLDAGNDATVTVGNTGSEFSRGFNFTFGIPKGEKGDPGQTGPAGPSANAQISGGTCYLMGLTSTTGDIVSTKTNASCFMSGGSLYSQNKEVLTAVTVDNHYAPKDGIKSGGTDYYINSIQYDGKGHITTIETGSTGTLLSNYVTKTELENKKYITGVTSDNHYDPSKNTPFITSGDTSKYINAISFDSNGHVTNIQTANTSDFVSNDTKYQSLSAQVITNKDNIEALSAQVITNKDNIEALSGSVTAFSSSVVTNIEAINKNITTANTLYFIGKSSTANESLGAAELFVASGAYITNSEFYGSAFYETSDERLKYFTSDVNVDFDKLKSIPKKYFMWKNREMNPTNIGTSAQKLQAVYPELVSESEGYLRVDYAKLSVIALAAVDKLHEENEELKERLKKIEEKLGL